MATKVLYSLLNRSNTVIPAILFAGMLFSCHDRKQQESAALKLLYQAVVAQDSNSVLHHLPPCLQLLGDSLVCMQLSATNFTVYNYYTGHIQERLSVDTNVLPRLLTAVQAKINPKYSLISEQQSKEVGAPKTRIECIIYNKKKSTYILIFDAAFCLDSPMVIKGKSEPFTWIRNIPFVTTLNAQRNSTGQYGLIDYRTCSPNFSYSGLLLGDQLILPNYDPQRAGVAGFGMLCSIDLKDTSYGIYNIDLPFDTRTLNLQKMNRTEVVRFTVRASESYYVTFGNRILYCKDDRFNEIYKFDSSEIVYDIYFNRSRSLLYLNTFTWNWEDKEQKGCIIYSLDIQNKLLTLLYSGKEASAIKFINDSTLLKLSENPEQQNYEFTVCQY